MTADPHTAQPPVAPRKPVETTLHGETLVDEYAWLREKDNPGVTTHLEAENAYADTVLGPLKPLADELYREMLARIKETDESVPYRHLGDYHYIRTEEGRQYPIFCRRRGSIDAPEEITLDVNALAEGKPFMSVGAYSISDDGRYLAYSTDVTGFREYTLQVKDLETGDLLPDSIEKTSTVCWAADGRTLVYATEDAAKRPYRIYRHTLGADPAADPLIYQEDDGMFRVGCWRSRSRELIFIGAASHTATEMRFLPATEPAAAPTLIAPREPEHEYDVDHHSDWFYIRTNDAGRNFRVVRVPVSDPGRSQWQEVRAHRDTTMVENVSVFARHMVVSGREDGLPCFEVQRFADAGWHRISFDEPAFEASVGPNREFDTTTLRYRYQSPVTPPSVYDYDLESRERVLLKQDEVLGGYDPSRYVVERLHVSAPDGVEVPVTIVRRRDVALDGTAPCNLIGYGSYGFPYPVTFDSTRISLFERGVIMAIAHVRGGGELGKPWHDAGRMERKMNTFTDFIAVADALVERGYSSRDRLVIAGGSAGGLLIGSVLNLRPDVAKAAVMWVPFVDVLNTMQDDSLPLTVGEWEEWGNPYIDEQYHWIRAYCPYTNIAERDYPAIFIRTSLNDSQVMYWEPAKYVAKLRTRKTDSNPLVLHTNMDAGHGGSSGRYDHLGEEAMDDAFMLWQMGLVDPATAPQQPV